LHTQTEFAGVAQERQHQWIEKGREILCGHGLEPEIWVAPRHGTDQATLAALLSQGLAVLSDGFAANPFRDRGVLWIPQQLWGPIEKRSGVWTICLHANTASDALCEELREFLSRFADQFTSVDQVLSGSPYPARSIRDRIFHWRVMKSVQFSRWKKQFKNRVKPKPQIA
jgi:hypothetical protein